MNVSVKEAASSIEQTIVKITCNKQLNFYDARLLRGVFTRICPNRPEFHGHGPKGLIYEHPKIQYKVVDGQALISGLQEGSFLLQVVDIPKQFQLGQRSLCVTSVDRTTHTIFFGLSQLLFDYRFVTPWIALNEENHNRFQIAHIHGKEASNGLLKRVLIGNLLSMSKALGYEVPGPIVVKMEISEPTQMILKPRVTLLGFLGWFRTNFWIPPFWGIGKQSARGFGVVERIERGPDGERGYSSVSKTQSVLE